MTAGRGRRDGRALAIGGARARLLVLVMTAAFGASTPQHSGAESECEAIFTFGWWTCTDGGDVAAAPYDLLAKEQLQPHQTYPLIRCVHPPWWKFWSRRRLEVVLRSGNLSLPKGDLTVWAAVRRSIDPSGDFEPYPATGTTDRAATGRYHETSIEGSHARSLAKRLRRGAVSELRWKRAEGAPDRGIGITTISVPLAHVLRACPG